MIKLILFDLDGVLVDTKDIHFDALNELKTVQVSRKELEISLKENKNDLKKKTIISSSEGFVNKIDYVKSEIADIKYNFNKYFTQYLFKNLPISFEIFFNQKDELINLNTLKKEIKESWLANASMENKQESIFDNCNYLKDLSIALGKTGRLPITLSIWSPVITLSFFTFIGILQINEK